MKNAFISWSGALIGITLFTISCQNRVTSKEKLQSVVADTSYRSDWVTMHVPGGPPPFDAGLDTAVSSNFDLLKKH